MPTSARRHRSKPAKGKRRLLAACATVVLVTAIAALIGRSADDRRPAQVPDFASNEFDSDVAIAGDDRAAPARLDRPVYLHSVVPGGAYTGTELRTAILGDPVVAAHYHQLDQSRLRAEVVQQDRLVHVSYRKGDQVFWTKNKVLLRQGETIITDGQTQIRARCGNCISEAPLQPTSSDEPDGVEFDRLVDAPVPSVTGSPVAALLQSVPVPLDPLGAGSDVTGLDDGPITPLAAGRSGSGVAPPLAASPGDPGNPGDPGPPADLPPGLLGPPSSPNPPGTELPPFTPFPELPPPGGNGPPPLVPPEDFLPPELPPPGVPPPYVPGEPVPVPEPGTLLLLGGGMALVRRLLKGCRPGHSGA